MDKGVPISRRYQEKKFDRAELNTVKLMFIPAQTTCPIRLASYTGRRHTPMAAGLKCETTIGNLVFPMLFAQPGLVIPNHQLDVTIMLQNCSDQDIKIPSNTTLGYLENLMNECFSNISLFTKKRSKRIFLMMPHSKANARQCESGLFGTSKHESASTRKAGI